MSRIRALLLPLLAPLALLGALASCADEQPIPESFVRAEPWDAETLELAASLPVQDGGRVKPLDTLAGFKLLKINGKRSLKLPNGEKLSRTAFILDCFFFPEQAEDYECFLVENDGVLIAVGVEPKAPRARYSYNALEAGRAKLEELADRLRHKSSKERTPVEVQLLRLHRNLIDFEILIATLAFARLEPPTEDSRLLTERLGEDPDPGLTPILRHFSALQAEISGLAGKERATEAAAFGALRQEIEQALWFGRFSPALLPPQGNVEEAPEWKSPGSAVWDYVQDPDHQASSLAFLPTLERLEVAKNGDRAAFRFQLSHLHGLLVERAEARQEYGKVPLEVTFYRLDFFTNALAFFLLSFLFVAIGWIAPRQRLPIWGAWGANLAGAGLVVAGVTLRCIVRDRPPVTTLYETILFVAGCAVLLCLFLEAVNRQRVALALAPLIGALGMFLAMKYELKEAAGEGDTMTSMVAVLDTNFWLAIHVTTISLGYSAGLLAAFFAHVWILGRLFGLKRGERSFYSGIARVVYGTTCFALLFSVIGTITGGVWANESWGRFWGWDPKENGALLICLAQLLILHARAGHYIRERGLALLAVLTGVVIAFSWWHVNQLDFGLHSYGRIDGAMRVLLIFYLVETLVCGLWVVEWLTDRFRGGSEPAAQIE